MYTSHTRDPAAAVASLAVCARTRKLQLCVLVYRCVRGLGREYLWRTSNSCPRFILARDRVRPPVPLSWFLPHAGLHLATEHSQSQELEHGTRYRPVSPPRRLSLSSFGRLLKNFSVPVTTASITLILCRGPEVLALSTTLMLAN